MTENVAGLGLTLVFAFIFDSFDNREIFQNMKKYPKLNYFINWASATSYFVNVSVFLFGLKSVADRI